MRASPSPSRRRLTEGEDRRASLPRHRRTRAQREKMHERETPRGSHHRLSSSPSVGLRRSPRRRPACRITADAPSSSSQSQPPRSFHSRRVSPRLRASLSSHLGRRHYRFAAPRCLAGAPVADAGDRRLPEITTVVVAEGGRSRAAVLTAGASGRASTAGNAAAATELHCRSPLLLGANCRAAAEPVRRPPSFRFSRSFESLWLLRKRFGAEVLVVGILIVDFGSRRKGRCDAFELWNLHFELAFELISGFELLKRMRNGLVGTRTGWQKSKF
ncbi:uncharacterized protein DS421_14g467010 [Arachis hypogaea]|nr:uncharacterized protein DS421_14g467010 [Arachis hypogaea]